MKHILALLLCTASFLLLSAQEPIKGFGKLKLGRSYSELLTDLDINEKKINDPSKTELSFYEMYKPKKPVLLKYDTAAKKIEYDYLYNKCPKCYKLLLPSYTVADIEIKNIELEFYNDTLYSIKIDNPPSQFTEAMTTKYGKGDLKKEIKKVNCSSAYVASYEVEESTFRTTWLSGDDNIKVQEVLMDYRDSKCKQQYLNFFLIMDVKKSTEVLDCQNELKKRQDQKKEADLKNKLNDF